MGWKWLSSSAGKPTGAVPARSPRPTARTGFRPTPESRGRIYALAVAHPDPAPPQRGARITTAEGDWTVQEVMLLGRAPLHYAVRMACPAGMGGSLSVVLSRIEFEALLGRALAPAGPAKRGSPSGKATPRR
jgi:hypothetical protein